MADDLQSVIIWNSVAIFHGHFVLDSAFIVTSQIVSCHDIQFFIRHFFNLLSSVLKCLNLVQSLSMIIVCEIQFIIYYFIVNLCSSPFFFSFSEFFRQIIPCIFACLFAFIHARCSMSHIVIPYCQEYSIRFIEMLYFSYYVINGYLLKTFYCIKIIFFMPQHISSKNIYFLLIIFRNLIVILMLKNSCYS